MIRLVGVSKVYDGSAGHVAALTDVSLEVAAGAFVALMGPNGCGKSTLLNLIAGVDLPSAGEVWVDGQELTRLPDRLLSRFRRDRVGIVYQFYNLLPTMTAWENVALPALLAGAPPRAARERAEEHMRQQELDTAKSTQVIYWEGAATAEGTLAGRPLKGRAYVELTGYAAPFRKRL